MYKSLPIDPTTATKEPLLTEKEILSNTFLSIPTFEFVI